MHHKHHIKVHLHFNKYNSHTRENKQNDDFLEKNGNVIEENRYHLSKGSWL